MPGSSDELVPYDSQDTPGLRRDSATDTRSVVDQILVDCPDMVLREVSIGSWPLYVLEGDRARCDIYPLGDLGWNINCYRKVGDYQRMEDGIVDELNVDETVRNIDRMADMPSPL